MARLSGRYAAALFDLSQNSDRLAANMQHAAFLSDALGDAQSRAILEHPRISAAEKHTFLTQVLSNLAKAQCPDGEVPEAVPREFEDFLRLVIDKRRVRVLREILLDFIDMGNDRLRKTTAYVTTAVPLSTARSESLAAMLSQKIGKQVTLEANINPDIIGGLLIQVDGWLIDRTVKKSLTELKNIMTGGDAV